MKCKYCDADIKDINLPCESCGKLNVDMQKKIEKDYAAKENVDSEKNPENRVVPAADKESKKEENKVINKKDKSLKTQEKDSKAEEKSKKALTSVFGKETKKSAKETDDSQKQEKKQRNRFIKKTKIGLGDRLVLITRYVLVAVIAVFVISLFFNWFSLSGDGVNIGYKRNEDSKEFLVESIRDKSVSDLHNYDKAIVSFSGYDLFRFSRVLDESYNEFVGRSGVPSKSFVSVVQKYYMMAIILTLITSIFSIVIIIISKDLKYISVVSNLSLVNLLILSLNYLTLKVPYLSMFAIKSKEVLLSSKEFANVNLSMTGLSMDKQFFPYEMYTEKGFLVALITLAIWFIIGTILKEVRHNKINEQLDKEIKQ